MKKSTFRISFIFISLLFALSIFLIDRSNTYKNQGKNNSLNYSLAFELGGTPLKSPPKLDTNTLTSAEKIIYQNINSILEKKNLMLPNSMHADYTLIKHYIQNKKVDDIHIYDLNRVSLTSLLYQYLKDQQQITKEKLNHVETFDYFFLLAKKLHRQNVIIFSKELFEKILSSNLSTYEHRAWYASLMTKFALFEDSPIEKIRIVNSGVDSLNLLISLAPNEFIVRHIRINTYSSLPSFFKKGDEVIDDLNYLDKLASSPYYNVNMYCDFLSTLSSKEGLEEKIMEKVQNKLKNNQCMINGSKYGKK